MLRYATLYKIRDGRVIEKIDIDKELIEYVVKRKRDLGTNNLGLFLEALFKPVASAGQTVVNLVGHGGGTGSYRIWSNIAVNMFNNTNCTTNENFGAKIAIGRDNTGADRSNYRVASIIDSKSAELVAYDPTTGILTIKACFTVAVQETVGEFGLYYVMCRDDTGTAASVLFDRTTLANPLQLNAGESVCVEYKIAI